MGVQIRSARADEVGQFVGWWRDLVASLKADDVQPGPATDQWYHTVFTQVLSGAWDGVVLVAQVDWRPVGGLMAAEIPGVFPWNHNLGRVAYGQGTYVCPMWRGAGLSKLLYRRAIEELSERGFNSYLGAYHAGNDGGRFLLESQGAQVTQTVTRISL